MEGSAHDAAGHPQRYKSTNVLLVSDPAGGKDGQGDGFDQRRRGLQVGAGQHAVAVDVGVNDASQWEVVETASQFKGRRGGDVEPAVGGHQAVLGIESEDESPRKALSHAAQPGGVAEGLGADDGTFYPPGECGLQVGFRSQTSTQLAPQTRKLGHGLDHGSVPNLTRPRPIEVDQVDPLGTAVAPALGHRGRVAVIHRLPREIALAQTHAASVSQIDGRQDDHWKPHFASSRCLLNF